MIIQKMRSVFNPEQFQGWMQNRNYFEGWYFKVINSDETLAYAFIPGIAMDQQGKKHAFIQILDGKKRNSEYHRFDFDSFRTSNNEFIISIGDNHFSADGLILALPGLNANLKFTSNVAWPKSWYSPGIMGPFSFLPFMECNHGIVSMDHSISGDLCSHNVSYNFDGGRGYIEKDWGKSFPSAYLWLQTNHFGQPGISLKTSIARIPYLGYSFVGFISGLWLHNELIQFTTYNRSNILKSIIETDKVEIEIQNKNHQLNIFALREPSTKLASPINGHMDGRIEESMNTLIHVRLKDQRSGEVLFNDTGRNGCLEVAGKIEQIVIS